MKPANFNNKIPSELILLGAWISIGVLSRVLPHVANVTALTSLSLLAGAQFSKRRAIGLVLITLILSDLILAYQFAYPCFGTWSLFTYSGFLAITLLGHRFESAKGLHWFGILISASLGYWLWTNLGVWLCDNLYAKTISGLLACYFAALPFLRNSCIGDIVWMMGLLGALKITKPKYHCTSINLK